MCFRPASTTMGARICMKCHYVCDDVSAEKCPQCGELKLPHVVCKNCGYYKGREIVKVEEA